MGKGSHMYSKVNTCVLQGLNGYVIEVETDLSRGYLSLTL